MKPSFSVVDDAWKKEFSSSYTLSLLIANDNLSYAILDNSKKKYVSIGNFSFVITLSYPDLCKKLKTIFSENEIFHAPYQQVNTALLHHKSTLVPDEMFDENEMQTYLSFNHTLEQTDRVLSDNLQFLKAKNIFSANSELLILLNEQFANVKIHHCSSSLIEVLLKENKFFNEKRMFVNVEKNALEIIVMEKGKLIFHNFFQYTSKEDFIYFILFVCRQLDLDPDKMNLYFIGEIDKKSPLYTLAYQYIRNVNFGRRPGNYNYSYKFAFFPSHHHFNMFCVNLLEN